MRRACSASPAAAEIAGPPSSGAGAARAPSRARRAAPDDAALLALFRTMATIRAFEERVRGLAAAGRVPGLVHLYSGQEAVATGVMAALAADDWIASHHRGHGHCIAKGSRLDRLFAEILGRRTGYGMGRGGSMHIMDPATRSLGCNGIVGGGIPLATGAALSARRRAAGEVAVAFFGDGALNQGIVFECFNMAALWSLPVLYVCENNRYGEYTASDEVTAGSSLLDRGRVFGMPAETVDGMDVLAVRDAAANAVARARRGDGPSLLVCETWRFSGHHVGDAQTYKDQAEHLAWQRRDPILKLRRQLARNPRVGAARLDEIGAAVAAEIDAAWRTADAVPPAEESDLARYVHAG